MKRARLVLSLSMLVFAARADGASRDVAMAEEKRFRRRI